MVLYTLKEVDLKSILNNLYNLKNNFLRMNNSVYIYIIVNKIRWSQYVTGKKARY